MEIHKSILDQLNERFVLLKQNDRFLIIDKKKRTNVIIDDPFINVEALINEMIKRKVAIFTSARDLPEPIEVPLSITDSERVKALKVFIMRLYGPNNKETGAIISMMTDKMVHDKEKARLERLMEDYAFSVLYPSEGINTYSNIYSDTASIIVIRGINDLPQVEVSAQIYDW